MKMLLTITFLLCLSSCQTPLSGEITDTLGQALETKHGKVNIIQLNSKKGTSFISNIVDGRFQIEDNLNPGHYMIETLVPGYETKSTKIQYPQTKRIKLSIKKLGASNIQNINANENQVTPAAAGTVTLTPPKY